MDRFLYMITKPWILTIWMIPGLLPWHYHEMRISVFLSETQEQFLYFFSLICFFNIFGIFCIWSWFVLMLVHSLFYVLYPIFERYTVAYITLK